MSVGDYSCINTSSGLTCLGVHKTKWRGVILSGAGFDMSICHTGFLTGMIKKELELYTKTSRNICIFTFL